MRERGLENEVTDASNRALLALDVTGRSGACADVPCNLSRNSSVSCTRMIEST